MSRPRTVLVTGASGMLGRTLIGTLRHRPVVGIGRSHVDLTQAQAVHALIARVRPEVIVHCAAMTAVDQCERDPSLAHAGNVLATGHIAAAAAAVDAHLIALSTDYVFAGTATHPYREDDPAAPRTVYGQTKRQAELVVQERCPRHTILRTAWLYGSGGPSFVHAILKACATPGPPLPVVNDQHGNPTSAACLSTLIARLLDHPIHGIVHGVCSGSATWYDLARTIVRWRGLPRTVMPCRTRDVPRPAQRPAYSMLATTALERAGWGILPHWNMALAQFLEAYPHG